MGRRKKAPFDIDRHAARLHDAVALADEMLPPRLLEVAQIHEEFEDGQRCKDPEHLARVDREAELRQRFYERMCSLWLVMAKAEAARSEAVSKTGHEMLVEAIRGEFDRRSGGDAPI